MFIPTISSGTMPPSTNSTAANNTIRIAKTTNTTTRTGIDAIGDPTTQLGNQRPEPSLNENHPLFRCKGFSKYGDLTPRYLDLLADLYTLHIGAESCSAATSRMHRFFSARAPIISEPLDTHYSIHSIFTLLIHS